MAAIPPTDPTHTPSKKKKKKNEMVFHLMFHQRYIPVREQVSEQDLSWEIQHIADE